MSADVRAGREPDALRKARVDLAACYRVLDRLGLNEGIDNHLTVMVPGTTDRFLCISYGLARVGGVVRAAGRVGAAARLRLGGCS